MSDATNIVLEYLKGVQCAYVVEIANRTGISQDAVVEILTRLEVSGLVRKVGEVLDVTKPVATAKWCLSQSKGELGEVKVPSEQLGVVVGLILNPPLISRLGYAPPGSLGLVDSLNTIICSARRNLRIMMPYLGDLLGTIFTNCLDRLRALSFIRVITEDETSNRQALERLKLYLPNLEVFYATKRKDGIKVAGVHAKVIIVDGEYAVLGTFNLTQAHILVNYDIGVVIKGYVVKTLTQIFDDVWNHERQEVLP